MSNITNKVKKNINSLTNFSSSGKGFRTTEFVRSNFAYKSKNSEYPNRIATNALQSPASVTSKEAIKSRRKYKLATVAANASYNIKFDEMANEIKHLQSQIDDIVDLIS
jgi:hypothetical protein